MTLDELHVGESALILTVGGEGLLRRRLLDMGLTPNTRVFMRKVAPLGDPMELYLRGYELTLRAQEAKEIEIHPDGGEGCAHCPHKHHRGAHRRRVRHGR
jgi:ferrous iron transport protein A